VRINVPERADPAPLINLALEDAMQRWIVRTLLAAVCGAIFALAQQTGTTVPALRVLIYDNGGTFMPGDPDTGEWGFTPNHIQVTRGEAIEFANPAGNARPHTVTSITWSGQPPMRTLTHGEAFDSSPTREEVLMPGSSWTLDTSSLEPAQYLYYCWLHPWMVGSITVSPAE
jgi:plastocyanin